MSLLTNEDMQDPKWKDVKKLPSAIAKPKPPSAHPKRDQLAAMLREAAQRAKMETMKHEAVRDAE